MKGIRRSEKTLSNSSTAPAKAQVKDLQVTGNPDNFKLLFKASSEEEGWMKSTKAMEIKKLGYVFQVTTQQVNPDGSYSVAESLTFVPEAQIFTDENGGRKLIY